MKSLSDPTASLPVFSVCFFLILSSANAEGPLPFENGRYGADPAVCEARDENDLLMRFGDQVGYLVRNIEGKKLDNGYELYCSVSNVSQQGKIVRFRAACEAEGNTDIINGSYEYISSTAFRLGERVFRKCDPASNRSEAGHETEIPKSTVAPLIEAAMHLEDLCRGSSGSHPNIDQYCEARDHSFKTLNVMGWCRGKIGQATYQYDWHKCMENSIQ